jgi:Ca-activated chloride channel family protein
VTFTWPAALVLLALIPAGAWLLGALDRRRRRRAAARGGLDLGGGGANRRAALRRIPALLFIAGFAVLVVSLARPQSVLSLPREEGTVILAFDVSGSMAATDLQPTRMAAAKAAAEAFVAQQPSSVVIGIVAFSDSGLAVQAPTNDQGAVLAAISRLAPERGTSLGEGILASLEAIALEESPPATDYYSIRSPSPSPSPSPTPTPTPVPAGTHTSAVIVLLTDGENNEAPDPAVAAQAAADRGIRIFTVGLGSPAGTTVNLDGFQVHTQLNEPLLQQIASVTDGAYYRAEDAQQLRSIYAGLDTRLVVEPEKIEITGLFAGAGILLLAAGGVASLVWLGRLP